MSSSSISHLTAKNLICERQQRILFKDLSFVLHPGEALQIVGANGCGKSSLLRILAGLDEPLAGEVQWNNQLINECIDDYLADTIYIGHANALKYGLTARENLQRATALGKMQQEITVDAALKQVGLQNHFDVFVDKLSAGQQRRVALARLLLIKARLWILDEPLAALDATAMMWFSRLLKEHVSMGGMVILTTHQPLVLDAIAIQQLMIST